ncbi:VWA domain-containing protein [Amycolatopsis sp. PS_44_ISF1]|uniref:vWA domain-containing protein n=1 Tax=Amycolatopsis sp. PS_44_ISF1 TaxID=2974917 RepID=UPI0028DF8606|nr:VWA domain-containing protein [Amycolatopsis sp. PS_44_ISF1]MDT8914904.1 VWA domain-containing protein [Amycolatopsis sp. PS_44_ISF1]
MTVTDRLTGFVRALREHGIPAGPSETVDAAAALEVLGFDDRELVREGLAAALVRRGGQRAVFDATFDLYFPAGVGAPELAREDRPRDLAHLRDAVSAALAEGDRPALAQLAGLAVDLLGHYGGGSGPGGGFSAHQTLDRLQPQTLITRVLAAMRAGAGTEETFADRLTRDEIRRRVEDFRGQVRTEARRRVAEVRGRERVAKHAIAPAADRVDFLLASRAQLAELRRTVQPLSRKLATRLAARRKRASRGQIDLRRTLRRSLGTGGVPLRPAYRHRRPGRPEIVLLCDLSGSVAGFANFTMLLVQALRDQFGQIRVFAFVDSTDEVTHLLTSGSADPEQLGARILSEAAVVRWDGHSDYGSALGQFAEQWLDAVGPRTSVLVLGDARTNGGDPNLDALRAVRDRARHVFWLNPERRALWSTGDSAALAYAELVEMHECRTAQQLSTLVTRLLPV